MNKNPKVIINGAFYLNNLTGIERVAHETTKRLDEISQKDEIGIILPKNVKNVPEFKNLTVYYYPEDLTSFPIWEQFILPKFLRKRKAISLEFGNTCSLFRPGISFLHDIYCELYPEDFVTKREKHERFYFRVLYRIIAYRAKKIITVSEFSRDQIVSAYHINPKKVSAIYNGYDHFKSIEPDYSIFNEFPVLSNPYYFSLGSLSKRKNIKWIVEYASRHPGELFALSGTSLDTCKIDDLDLVKVPSNIIQMGYLSDSKIRALMEKCKAFILPSYYEGFGLTPLEALFCGAKIIVSNAASLPEIYGNAAHYIDPFNANIDLDELLKQPVEVPDKILKKYSYNTSAQQVYELIKEYQK
ncbi:glycosyl transferase family 1 [Spirochaetia bacterium]|nr:glycosyl transferase family 1 [Spirochaetia bacterium]